MAGSVKQTKRKRRTRAQIEQLHRQIHEVCEADHPVSVRHVFYRMTDPRLPEPVDKTERGYEQVGHAAIVMRRSGAMPYGWIADSTRMGWHVPAYASPAEFVRQSAAQYRFDAWADAGEQVEVWVESASIAGVLRSETRSLGVSLYPCRGFASLTLAYEAAQHYIHDGRPVAIYYVGDYDPAGKWIDRKLHEELRGHAEPEGVEVAMTRLAINPEQIERYGLPTKPRKAGERRMPGIVETVEAEAMPAPMLRQMVREAVESHLPTGALEHARLMERQGREYLRMFGKKEGGDDQ